MSFDSQRADVSREAIRRFVASDPSPWFPEPGELICLEGEDNALARIFDYEAATDWIYKTKRGLYPIACRAQSDSGHWKSHTIRCALASGQRTEWHKLTEARASGALGPAYNIHMYLKDDELIEGACIDTPTLLDRMLYAQEDPDEPLIRRRNPDDGTWFFVAWWSWFRSDQIRIVTGTAIERPRTRRGATLPSYSEVVAKFTAHPLVPGETDADRLRLAGGRDFSGWQPYQPNPVKLAEGEAQIREFWRRRSVT